MNANIKNVNAVRSMLIDLANKNNVDLSAEFKTAEDFNQFVISFCIKTGVSFGQTVDQAYDMVIGDGEYKKMSDSVRESLKAA